MQPALNRSQVQHNISRAGSARLALRVSFLAGMAGLYALLYQAWGSGLILGRFSPNRLLGALPVALLALAALAASGKSPTAGRIQGWLERLFSPGRLSRPAGIAFWLLWLVFPAVCLLPAGETVFKVLPRIWIFAHLVLAGALLWQAARPGRTLLQSLGVSLLAYTSLVKVASFLPDIQAWPFSLGWSEASRFYYASLFRSEALYGQAFPLPTLHPARYLLQAVPWLAPTLPLWVHRLWQVLLWLGLTLATAVLLARRLKIQAGPVRLLFTAWAALFLFQGPVYYHLALCALPVLWGLDTRRPWRSLGWVLAGSLWAGISRINWIPLPGCLAALLYFIEEARRIRPWAAYLLPPAAYAALGTAAGLAAQAAYQAASGAPAGQFNTSLTSDLLWYRLLPSSTYPLGVLPAVILASAGLAAVLFLAWRAWRRQIPLLRQAGIAAVLAVFLLGGLVVSVKIGGGSNLHNLDAYLLLLLVAGAGIWAGRLALEDGTRAGKLAVSTALVALALIIPALPVVQSINPVSLPPVQAAGADLAILQQYLDQADAVQGEVLFITERHLIPFRYVDRVQVFPDYEKVFLMEMVMAGSRDYLGRFWADLHNRRFALIITEPVSTALQDRSHAFSEENNVWVEGVSIPLLENYRRAAVLPASGVWIMVPQ